MSTGRADSPPVLAGRSPRIRQILHLINKLGKSKSPVLILGETGTGKEVVARAIRFASPPGPFVPIDCSALVGPLMESELFGHVRGAFTGAAGVKTGLIEMADRGTAFFDEIGELSLDLQSKLLRLIQEKEFRPVGSVERRSVDFRLVAATNRDLAREAEEGRFRRDLYYRLNVVTLRLPPLRERREDIPALADQFLANYGNRHVLTRECLDAMLAYEWPGNVRELENCIQRMVAINTGPLLHTADLPSALQNDLQARRSVHLSAAAKAGQQQFSFAFDPPSGLDPAPSQASPPKFSLMEMEKHAIVRALEFTKGDRVMAAHLLGIGRTTLYRKLKEYSLGG